MRDLILVRGAPGSGKSTWIAEHHLEPYTISSDVVRQLFSCPEDDPITGESHISQRNEQAVWEFIEDIVELRMKTGQFIVLDAQNIRPQRWVKLAEKYRYRVWKHEMDTTQEECLARNAKRPPLTRVPEHVIMASFWRIGNNELSKSIKEVPDDVLNGVVTPMNVDKYKRIYFIGDCHSCYTAVKSFFDSVQGPKEDDLYVFVGDYLDRGLEHKQMLEYLCGMRDMFNVMFLTGNHCWERYWAEDRLDEIKSKEFLNNTMPALTDIDKKAVREWCSRWIQMAYLEFHGTRFFVTHAGLGYLPEHIRYVPSHVYIRGGAYEDDIDVAWCKKNYGPNLIQVHGHRNWYNYKMEDTENSINLNSGVEFGEDLRVFSVYMCDDDLVQEFHYYPNPVHREGMSFGREAAIMSGQALATPQERVEILTKRLRRSKGINEKQLKNDISSFNFTRDVFYSDNWDDMKSIARGLFIDTLRWRIVARGYQKFFNYRERSHNSKEWLKEHLVFPVKCYRKYNGFLALVSWNHGTDELFIATKSTNDGEHTGIAKLEFERCGLLSKIEAYLKEHDVTMLFEICTPLDPHIIKEERGPVLLDIVSNVINFGSVPFDELCGFADVLGIRRKVLDRTVKSWEELEPVLDQNWVLDIGGPVEGWVLTDANGYSLKLKTCYYQRWKRLRTVMNLIQDGTANITEASFPEGLTHDIFAFMKKLQQDGKLEGKSIIDVRDLWLESGGVDYPYKPEGENNGSEE